MCLSIYLIKGTTDPDSMVNNKKTITEVYKTDKKTYTGFIICHESV